MQNVPKIVQDRLRAAKPAVDHPDADQLTAFAEQSLTAGERTVVLDHLALCGDCREIVALALPEQESIETVPVRERSRWLAWPILRWGFVAAGVVTIASLGVQQYRLHSGPQMMASKSEGIAAYAPGPGSLQPPAEQRRDKAVALPFADAASKAPPGISELDGSPGAAATGSPKQRAFQLAPPALMGGKPGYGPKMPTAWQNNNAQVSNNAPVALNPDGRAAFAFSVPQSSSGGVVTHSGTNATEGDVAKTPNQPIRPESFDRLERFSSLGKVDKAKTLADPGQIGGYVVDPTGAVVSNARITITPARTGQTATATALTNSQGAWLVAGLPSGNYKAQAAAAGFKTSILDFNYDANQPFTQSFTLSPGSVSEVVEVSSAQSMQVQTDAAGVAGPIRSQSLHEIPVNGRNYVQLASISPGSPTWEISASGALQRSFDQGKSWQSVDVNTAPASPASMEIAAKSRATEKDAEKKAVKREAAGPIFRAVVATGSDVWAGGSGAALYHSTDAGSHWTRLIPATASSTLTGDIVTLEFPDPQNGKITTSTTEIWITKDAGQSWQKE